MSRNSGFTPPPIPTSPDGVQASSVRRHHTISSTSGRNGTRISERRDSEEFTAENEGDEGQWPGGSDGAGEKQANLQRNLSLPSKYHRGLYFTDSTYSKNSMHHLWDEIDDADRCLVSRDQPGTHSGSLTPSNAVGGLSSVDAGLEEEEWTGVANALYEADDVSG